MRTKTSFIFVTGILVLFTFWLLSYEKRNDKKYSEIEILPAKECPMVKNPLYKFNSLFPNSIRAYQIIGSKSSLTVGDIKPTLGKIQGLTLNKGCPENNDKIIYCNTVFLYGKSNRMMAVTSKNVIAIIPCKSKNLQ